MHESQAKTPKPGIIADTLTRLVACHDLPEQIPDEPMPLFRAWFDDAQRNGGYDDPNAMTLATASTDGEPAARIVLCKGIETDPPALVFYTSYESPKARDLEANPRAATVFHWPHAKRQVRIGGQIERVSDAESDAYFQSRPLLSRIGARVSHQSEPLPSRNELVAEAMRVARSAAVSGELTRPSHWGGYRLHIGTIELWSGRDGRLHDRVRWTRDGDVWSAQRLSP